MNDDVWASSVVRGKITHVRSGDVRHRFTNAYRSFLLDLDELVVLQRRVPWLLGIDRRRPLTLRTSDHLATEPGEDIRARIGACLQRHELAPCEGRILGLVTLRGLGTGFDPVTLWFCHDAADVLQTIVVDVHNTYGESHPYVIVVDPDRADRWVHATLTKRFHVSPFLPQDGDYEVSILPPDLADPVDAERIVFRIAFAAADGRDRLVAVLHGRRSPLHATGLARLLAAEPMQGLRSTLIIRFEAFRLWRRGATFRHRPPWAPGVGHERETSGKELHG